MLYRKRISAVLLLLTSFAAPLKAEPYRLQANANLTQSKYDSSIGDDVEIDAKQISLYYYLRPVTSSQGPLGESAFLSKSAFITGLFSKTDTSEFARLGSRFVTQSNLIFEFGIDSQKDELILNLVDEQGTTISQREVPTDRKNYITIGIGKYIDDTSEAVLSLRTNELDSSSEYTDNNTLSGRYRRLIDGATPNTHIALGAGLGFIDTFSDSGYQINVSGNYYLSNKLSAGANISYRDVGKFSSTGTSLNGKYFFTESLLGQLRFSRNSNPTDLDSTVIGLGIGARF